MSQLYVFRSSLVTCIFYGLSAFKSVFSVGQTQKILRFRSLVYLFNFFLIQIDLECVINVTNLMFIFDLAVYSKPKQGSYKDCFDLRRQLIHRYQQLFKSTPHSQPNSISVNFGSIFKIRAFQRQCRITQSSDCVLIEAQLQLTVKSPSAQQGPLTFLTLHTRIYFIRIISVMTLRAFLCQASA